MTQYCLNGNTPYSLQSVFNDKWHAVAWCYWQLLLSWDLLISCLLTVSLDIIHLIWSTEVQPDIVPKQGIKALVAFQPFSVWLQTPLLAEKRAPSWAQRECTGIFISFSCLPRGWVYSRTHILTESLHPGHATWPAPDSHSTITLHKHIAGSHHRHTPTAWSRGASLQHSEEGKKGKAGRENSWDLPTAYQNTGSWSGCLPPAYPVLVNVQYLPVPISPQPIHLRRASLSSSSRPRTILGVTSMPRTKESWKHHEEKSWGKDRAILANISRSKTC